MPRYRANWKCWLSLSSLIQPVFKNLQIFISKSNVSSFFIDWSSDPMPWLANYILLLHKILHALFVSWNRIRILYIAFKTPMTQIKRVYSLTQATRNCEFHCFLQKLTSTKYSPIPMAYWSSGKVGWMSLLSPLLKFHASVGTSLLQNIYKLYYQIYTYESE